MASKLIFFLMLWSWTLRAHSLVFIHIGKELPSYLSVAIEQARLFNPDCDFYLLCASNAARPLSQFLKEHNVTQVALDSLHQSAEHRQFCQLTKLDKTSLNGFWLYTSERFFYLEEFMRQHQLTDVFHLENDLMLYVDLTTLLPIFHAHYAKKMGLTFEREERCVPGIVYIADAEPLRAFTRFFSELVKAKAAPYDLTETDMGALGRFKHLSEDRYVIDLPVLLPHYPLQGSFKDGSRFSRHFKEFDSIFDAAAIGQYLGGVSPVNINPPVPGYVNPLSCFRVSDFDFTWESDSQGRKVPFILFNGVKKRINNLHIHCKNLGPFSSLNLDGK